LTTAHIFGPTEGELKAALSGHEHASMNWMKSGQDQIGLARMEPTDSAQWWMLDDFAESLFV